MTAMLNLGGKQGIVSFTAEEIEIRTEMEQAQFDQIRLMNIAMMCDQGWIDQEEAAMRAVGYAPVGESINPGGAANPINADGGRPGGQTDTNPNAGGSDAADS
ncbi:hypothetical protein J2T17_004618 [Paenibacillus mucilaginosus]|uniref:hypothetical protein n=1 Tax=Paenibacillus mucilaginosus TaxID=61624 RepID=UPI003D252E56